MESLQRTRLLSAAVLTVVLGSGVVLGLALDTGLGGAPEEAEGGAESQAADREGRRSERRPPMYRQVGALSEEQDARIDSIIHEHRDSMRALQREFSEAYDPRYWAIIETTRASIREVLSPTQVEKYDSLLAEYDRRRRHKDDDSGNRRK